MSAPRRGRPRAPGRLLTDKQVAERLGVHVQTPANWRRKSTPSHRCGPPWIEIPTGNGDGCLIRYDENDLNDFINQKRAA